MTATTTSPDRARLLGAGAAAALLLWSGLTVLGPSWYAVPWWAVGSLVGVLLAMEAARGLLSRRGASVRFRAVATWAFALVLLGDLALRQAPRRALFPAVLPVVRIVHDADRNTAWDTPNSIQTRTVIARLADDALMGSPGYGPDETAAAWTRILPPDALGDWRTAPVAWPDEFFDLPEAPYGGAVIRAAEAEGARWVRLRGGRMLIVDPAGGVAVHLAFSVQGITKDIEDRVGW